MSEQIKKVLSNVTQTLTDEEQAQARANIGAQAQLTAGTNIYINPDNVISVSGMTPDKVYVFNDNSFNRNAVKQAFDAGKLVYVNTKFAPDYSKVVRLRLAGYDDTTVNGVAYEVYWFCSPVTRYDAAARKYGNAEFNLQAHFYYYNKATGVVTSSGGTSWQLRQPDWAQADDTADNFIANKPTIPAFVATGSDTQPVYIDSDNEFAACSTVYYTGSSTEWKLKDTLTLNGTANEQDWDVGPQVGWPYGFKPHEFHYSSVLTVPTDLIVRFYIHEFLYAGGTFTPKAERLAWVGFLPAGTQGLDFTIRTFGVGNNTYLDGGRVTVQPLTAASGTITVDTQVGNYNPMPVGNTLGTLPTDHPSGPWTPPNP